MGIHVALTHQTVYRYDRLVSLQPQVIRLRPAPHCRTPILSYSLKVEPTDHFLNWQQDPYGNYQARLVFPDSARELSVRVDLIADMTVINSFDFFVEEAAEKFPYAYDPVVKGELTPYLQPLPISPAMAKLLADAKRDVAVAGRRSVDVLCDLNRLIHDRVGYVIRMEPGVQTPEVTLANRTGSCRDSGWLLVQMLRHLGMAARFVSGYLIQLTPDVKSLDGPSGAERDFTDLHAWAEVYLPGAGWVGLDPTSGLLASEGHLPLACTADPQTAAPISGSFAFTPTKKDDKVEESFEFDMQVRRIREEPRVTKPYAPEQWERIMSLGRRIDGDLSRSDVRLSMGGEPTFVSIDDLDSPQWNTEALGPEKRRQAGQLFERLADRWATGALLHKGQGKWYPGEQLPRWALGCYWRADGKPIWRDRGLYAPDNTSLGHDEHHAQRFITRLTHRLSVHERDVVPGYEDVWYHLWRERRLPVNVDPFDSRLKDEQERIRLAKIFEQGLEKLVGFALPIQRWYYGGKPGWRSGPWFFRSERMYLIPGDSPMGYRLPLDSLPWVAPRDANPIVERDPMEKLPPLPDPHRWWRNDRRNGDGVSFEQGYREQTLPDDDNHNGQYDGNGDGHGDEGDYDLRDDGTPIRDARIEPFTSARNLVRTAICVQPRDGKLHVFMPPTRTAEDYLDLIAAIEDTAAATRTPVVIEGYTPPFDPRIKHFKITPDPGVIEVNIQPATDWSELVDNTNTLYEEARLCRLATEKFLVDGRHTGTGGGNHVVIGGVTPSDSPLLRRPDVLASLIAYWNNHPALSFLFSGMFVGPTSQAPRVDEARHDSLYELEIALKQIPDAGAGYVPPWLVDRLLRHLLVDLTGNTHRTALCIDKLYSPDSATGRLGLLELRSFEMPPHSQMSLTQQLLLRGLISAFWNKRYDAPLVRWGTQIHDRFMLPHWVWQDMTDIVSDLRSAGMAFEESWFDAHQEFRFPRVGGVNYRGIELELRHAIEPWHVLGEEATSGGTARYVDSSLERMEVKVTGLTDSRHVIACNGRALPLHPTGVAGQSVAGVRFRAWQPPSCLHPHIGVHAPLVFDVIDTWSGRSVGGCTYHVSHPGGRSHEKMPVNSLEAQSRRVARFFPFGHTPGPMPVPVAEINPRFPMTLDLRRPAPPLPTGGSPQPVTLVPEPEAHVHAPVQSVVVPRLRASAADPSPVV